MAKKTTIFSLDKWKAVQMAKRKGKKKCEKNEDSTLLISRKKTHHTGWAFGRRKIISAKCHRKSALFILHFPFVYSGSSSIKYLLKNEQNFLKRILRWNRMREKKNLFLVSPLNQKSIPVRFNGAWCDFHLISSHHVPCNHLTGVHLLEFLPFFYFFFPSLKIKPSQNVFSL